MTNLLLEVNEDNIDDSGKIFFTYNQLKSFPEFPVGPLIELLNGDLFLPPSPSIFHQQISARLNDILRSHVISNKLGTVLYAPIDVIFSDIDVTIPDLLVITNKNKHIINKKNIQGAPDLIIEILSGNRDNDLIIKKNIYQKYRVLEYLVIDPVALVIIQHTLINEEYVIQIYKSTDILISSIIPGLKISLKEIFN